MTECAAVTTWLHAFMVVGIALAVAATAWGLFWCMK
jgi:hypothetical protein